MSDFDPTNRGALFPNDKKTNPAQPDYKGKVNINGVEYWLDGWKKTSKDGSKKFLSLSATPKVAPAENPAPSPAPADTQTEPDPF